MSGDTIIYLIMGAVILFLVYEFLSVVKERDEYREKYDDAEWRLYNLSKKVTSLMRNQIKLSPPAPTIEERKFIVIENAGDNGVLNHQVAIYINDGYTFDPEASNDKYLAFRKIVTIEKEGGV